MSVSTAKVEVEVKPRVGVGLSTIAGGSVTLAAYIAALVAVINGARDEATITAAVVGTIALVTTIAGRVAQAVAVINRVPVAAPVSSLAEAPLEAGEVSDYGAARHAAESAASNAAAAAPAARRASEGTFEVALGQGRELEALRQAVDELNGRLNAALTAPLGPVTPTTTPAV